MIDELDWSQHECMLAAVDQGLCGSCYVHSAVSLLEFHLCKKKLLKAGQRLSRELVLDCGPAYSDALTGCQSGESNVTLNMLSDMGLFWREQDYRNFYTTTVVERNVSPRTVSAKKKRPTNTKNKLNNNYKFVPYDERVNEDRWTQDRCIFEMDTQLHDSSGDMEDWVASQSAGEEADRDAGDNNGDHDGPSGGYRLIRDSISYKNILDSGDFKQRLRYGPIGIQMYFPDETNDYTEGIFDGGKCLEDAKNDRNLHAMVMVGYGRSNGLDYYIIRNTWGPHWGLKGNIRVATTVPHECFAYGYYLVDSGRPRDHFVNENWHQMVNNNNVIRDDNYDDNVVRQMLTMLSSLNLYDITLAERLELGTHS